MNGLDTGHAARPTRRLHWQRRDRCTAPLRRVESPRARVEPEAEHTDGVVVVSHQEAAHGPQRRDDGDRPGDAREAVDGDLYLGAAQAQHERERHRQAQQQGRPRRLEEYREHFEVDEHGNWTAGDTDAEREAAWSEYYGEEGPPADDAVAEDGTVAVADEPDVDPVAAE